MNQFNFDLCKRNLVHQRKVYIRHGLSSFPESCPKSFHYLKQA